MMSNADVEFVRRVYETWNMQGLQTLETWASESIELVDAPQLPDSGTWRGRADVLARLAEVADAVGGTWVDIKAVEPAGGEVLVSMLWREDRAPDSAELGEVFHLVRVAAGHIDRMRVFLQRDAALAAVDDVR